jgi:type IV pilus assembly protein PilA
MSPRPTPRRAFTLVELMIVVAIVGVLAALSIYGVRKYVSAAKTTEARNSLGIIAKSASASFDREGMSGTVLTVNQASTRSDTLCPPSSAIPSTPEAIQGRKYQSDPSEWSTDPGWICLKFQMKDPQYYRYQYVADGLGRVGDGFTAYAWGDLNGDGRTSQFSISGLVQGSTGSGVGIELTIAPNLIEFNPDD